MNDAIEEIFRACLLNRQTGILERHSIYIDRPAIGIQDDDHLRYGVGNATKLVFILSALLLCLFCCGDVCYGAYELGVPECVSQCTGRYMDVLDGSVRH